MVEATAVGESTNDWLVVSTTSTMLARAASSEDESSVIPMRAAPAACMNRAVASDDVA